MSAKTYDGQQLVELIGAGQLSYARIAEEVGLSASQVGCIARGESRPELQSRIRAISADQLRQARRALCGYARSLVVAHVSQGLKGTDESARKAREFLLARVLPADMSAGEDAPDEGRQGLELVGLTREDLHAIAVSRGFYDGPFPAWDDGVTEDERAERQARAAAREAGAASLDRGIVDT